jgi:hypothetical protein
MKKRRPLHGSPLFHRLQGVCRLAKILKDGVGGFPSQRAHWEMIVILMIIVFQLLGKILKEIEQVGGIEAFIFFPVTPFNFTVMP